MVRENLDNRCFGEWQVIHYAGNRKQLCRCSCGEIREVATSTLKSGKSNNCGSNIKHPDLYNDKAFIDITNQQFGVLKVIKYLGNSRWKCLCTQCNKEITLLSKNIRSNSHLICTHTKEKERYTKIQKKDYLLGKEIGDLTVISKINSDKYLCRCICGVEKEVRGYSLKNASQTSYICNHTNIIKRRFGKLVVDSRLSNRMCKCTCDCGNTKEVFIGNLLNGTTNSCGCSKDKRYTREQVIEMIQEYTYKNKEKPLTTDLSDILNLGMTSVYTYINDYKLKEYINTKFKSRPEKELWTFITSMVNAEHNNRTILNGLELDIYIPSKRIAIEFNGTYWHSTINKDKYYHQQKTISCAKQGIQLIHIFEYEWENKDTQVKLKNYLKDILENNYKIMYARKLSLCEPSIEQVKQFENKYHLQGYTSSSTKIGLKDNNELIGIMTFGEPRFNNNYDYEVVRLCYKTGVRVVGGSERMLKYFVNKYKPYNIITYVDISKFTGNSYIKLGFKPLDNGITKPNYVWVDNYNNILNRYSTMKNRLVKNGLGTYEQTEDEIMYNSNYLKIYDSGNIKLIYTNKNT